MTSALLLQRRKLKGGGLIKLALLHGRQRPLEANGETEHQKTDGRYEQQHANFEPVVDDRLWLQHATAGSELVLYWRWWEIELNSSTNCHN